VSYISASLRRDVTKRAGGCCEYCRLSREDHVLPFEIDHIVSEKHLGPTQMDNLCLSCWDCNNAKGSDVAAADPLTGNASLFFHPRRQLWESHFRLDDAQIIPLTPEGRVTVFVLQLNAPERVQEREMLIELGSYPCRLTE